MFVKHVILPIGRKPVQRVSERRGFTLIELLVVISILVTLLVITATMVRLSLDGDKVRAGARQIQSFLNGARDRAIYAKAPVGVRFIKSPNNDRTITSMVYIQPGELWSDGTIELQRRDVQDPVPFLPPPPTPAQLDGLPANPLETEVWTVAEKAGTNWANLIARNRFPTDVRIRIPKGSQGTWYRATLERSATSQVKLRLATPFRLPAETTVATLPSGEELRAFAAGRDGVTTYDLQLDPVPFVGQKPVFLPAGVVVHLDRSSRNIDNLATASNRGNILPTAWRIALPAPNPPRYSDQIDIMFSPSGTVIGQAATAGLLHLYVGTQKDADLDRLAWEGGSAAETEDSENRGDKYFVSVATRTGAVSVHEVGYGAGSDRLLYAETGEGAGK
jgi:prepilin-type N-terminal cleavage/methylation domain-containing protein